MNIENIVRKSVLDKSLKITNSPRSLCKIKGYNITDFLDSNEHFLNFNFYKKINLLNRYQTDELISKLAKILANIYNINEKNILITRGSDEGIDGIIKAFCERGTDSILICPPTFKMYEECAYLLDINVINVPLKHDLQLNLDEILLAIENNKIKIIFIPNPHAPFGHIIMEDDIEKLCRITLEKDIILVIDEAYIEYTSIKSFSNKIEEYKNIVILRTLSKAYGMAGLRIGALIADENILPLVRVVLAPFHLSVASLKIAITFLSEKSNLNKVKRNISTILREKEKLFNELVKLPYIKKVFKSEVAFIFFISKYSNKIFNYCAKNGILINPMDSQVKNGCRISVGSHKQNLKLIELLKKFKYKK